MSSLYRMFTFCFKYPKSTRFSFTEVRLFQKPTHHQNLFTILNHWYCLPVQHPPVMSSINAFAVISRGEFRTFWCFLLLQSIASPIGIPMYAKVSCGCDSIRLIFQLQLFFSWIQHQVSMKRNTVVEQLYLLAFVLSWQTFYGYRLTLQAG